MLKLKHDILLSTYAFKFKLRRHTKTPLHFYDNIQHTIAEYRKAWGEPEAPVRFLVGRARQSLSATSSTGM